MDTVYNHTHTQGTDDGGSMRGMKTPLIATYQSCCAACTAQFTQVKNIYFRPALLVHFRAFVVDSISASLLAITILSPPVW